MKNLFLTAAVAIALFTAACNNGQTLKRVVIDGKIANFMLKPDYNHFTLTVVDFGGSPTTYKTTVNKDGTFKIYFDQYLAQDVSLTPLVRTFITHPGDSIHIDLDYASYGDVKISGDSEETNIALAHYTNEYYSNFNLSEITRNFRSQQDKSGYKQVSTAVRSEMMRGRDEFIAKYHPNDEVLTWSKNFVDICYYQSYRRLFSLYVMANKIPRVKAFAMFRNFTKSINEEDIFNNTLLNSDSYLIYDYLMPEYAATKKYDNVAIVRDVAKAIEKSDKSPMVKQLLLGGIFYNILNRNEVEAIDQNRQIFDKDITAPFVKAPLTKFYTKVKDALANPKIASDAVLKNMTGSAKNFIDSVRSQNKGKVTYIDFWATWCGPCKKELPFSKKLIEKYKGKDISFVFVCLNSPKDTWKASLAQMKLAGNQYFFDLKQSEEIRKGFNITAIPRYMILNKEGIISDMDATRPSDLITVTKIDRLLN
jgi:thiol-disulfide isomerase/thioredoxin